ncbi:uncharacterized protein LOC127845563 isoform X2 [Dreissena polymorpha]|uniref:uncharacterized protein LOC127845563 isoform X2 n=1 Tax=Dreissena polymorpha TaxID=45954 RepID=UPI0022640235|nr:uncharacterized protein LOC127845563 isoform X2 [Dreissena polymorpha]
MSAQITIPFCKSSTCGHFRPLRALRDFQCLRVRRLHRILPIFKVILLLAPLILLSKAQNGTKSISENNQVCLIVPPEVEQCYKNFQGKQLSEKAAQVNCLQKLLWNFTPDYTLTESQLKYFRSLLGNQASAMAAGGPGGSLIGLPPSGRRARKEYRLLSVPERQKFHAALNKLYEDGAIAAFARLYARASDSHHGGASFLPWNRVMLVMFEEALRRHDPSVSLPYWDVTIDHDVDNPVNSVLWTPEYFGAGSGEVMDGPAAGWVTNQGNLERNYGRKGRLISKDVIRNILQGCNLRDISQPFASRRYDLEYHHGGPHVWVGGDMAHPATSAYDPVFYMYHAFIDYIWEVFRRRQYRRCGVDPSRDYPEVPLGNSHATESPMVGFEWLKNRDGLQHDWIDNWYYYQSTPSCPNCCDGCSFPPPISCDRRRDVCVARSRRNFAFGPRSESTRIKDIFAQAQLDPREIESLTVQPTPRNRGQEFPAPPNDSRTIQTAIADAYESVRRSTEQGPIDRTVVESRDSRAVTDPRDPRAPIEPRGPRASIDARDSRSPIDARDPRAIIDPRDSRSSTDSRDPRTPIDARDLRAPIDPRDSRAPIDTRDHIAPVGSRDIRGPIDPRDPLGPADRAPDTLRIRSSSSRDTIDPTFDSRGSSRFDLDPRMSVDPLPLVSEPRDAFVDGRSRFDPVPDRIPDPRERFRDPQAFNSRNSPGERSTSRDSIIGLQDSTFDPRLSGPPARGFSDSVRP